MCRGTPEPEAYGGSPCTDEGEGGAATFDDEPWGEAGAKVEKPTSGVALLSSEAVWWCSLGLLTPAALSPDETAILLAPPDESTDKSVVGFVDAYERCV